jgi:ATP-dependent Lon protease
MTGEIDLRGEALAIGGLKEKALAALRLGIKDILIPHANQKDLEEIDPELRNQLRFHPVKHVEEVFEQALVGWIRPETLPSPRKTAKPKAKPVAKVSPATKAKTAAPKRGRK